MIFAKLFEIRNKTYFSLKNYTLHISTSFQLTINYYSLNLKKKKIHNKFIKTIVKFLIYFNIVFIFFFMLNFYI